MTSGFIQKKVSAVLILLVAFTIGYVRETTFLVINSVINKTGFPYNTSYFRAPDFLYDLNESSLVNLKWGLTFLFSLIFMGITLFLVNFYFKSKSFNKLTIFTYSLLFICSFLIYFLGILFGQHEAFYAISRFIAGLLQYPLLTLIMFTMFYFISRLNNNQ